MVGYHKHDSLTTRQKLLAGGSSGVMTRFLTQPLDILKLRTQVQRQRSHRPIMSMQRTARRILREEGISAFWHGHVLGQLHSILSVTCQFCVYEIATQWTSDLEATQNFRPHMRFLCGVFAGACSATLVLPLEVIRVRQMLVKDQYKNLITGARAVYRYGGILAFYEGLSASVLQLGPQVGISFLVFSSLQPVVLHWVDPHNNDIGKTTNRYDAQSLLVASCLAGCVAGVVSKSITYPLDLAKRRLQIGSHKESRKYAVPSTSARLIKCNTLVDCLSKTIKKQGFIGLFQGLTVTVWKAAVTNVVAFTSYELLCFSIREYNDSLT